MKDYDEVEQNVEQLENELEEVEEELEQEEEGFLECERWQLFFIIDYCRWILWCLYFFS